MKKILLTFYFALCTFASWGAKINTQPMYITQSDGSKLTVLGYGDENFHWYTTTDGALLAHSGSYYYIASIDDNGNICASTQLAHEPAERTLAELSLIASQNKEKYFSLVGTRAQKAAIRREKLINTTNPPYFPHIGSPKAVVILAQYQDVKFTITNPQKVFDEYLNGDVLNDYGHKENQNYGSVKKYFKDISFNKFTPQFDVYGPVTLSQDMAYYGKNTSDNEGSDQNTDALVQEACQLADPSIDFSQYDSDNDGYADLVYVIYAGYGENNGASTNTIWPKSGTTFAGTYDGKKVCRYGVNNELNYNESFTTTFNTVDRINGIGLFCHEFSHTMGLPDMYPSGSASSARIDNQEMEYWDLMDGGEYLGKEVIGTKSAYGGYCPAPYTAWEREVMGWMSLDTLKESKTNIEITPINNNGKAYRILNNADGNEYLVLENIQNSTGWSSGLLGHGILVYHVKWPNYPNVYMEQHPNDTPGKPGMAVVPADKLLISYYSYEKGTYTRNQYIKSHGGDPFPGTSNITCLNDTMGLPNFNWYTSGPKVNKALNNIVEDTTTGVVTFDFISDFATGINYITIATKDDDRIYSIDGRYVGTDQNVLPKGIYIKNKKKFIIK
jgi:immune inhibitor A